MHESLESWTDYRSFGQIEQNFVIRFTTKTYVVDGEEVEQMWFQHACPRDKVARHLVTEPVIIKGAARGAVSQFWQLLILSRRRLVPFS